MKREIQHKHRKPEGNKQTAKLKVADNEQWKNYTALAGILLISFIAYLPILHNGFVWDDIHYIKNNPFINAINLKQIFSQYVMGNYHPVTILTLAIEHRFFGLDETGYHAVNLIFHLMNVILVFYTVFLVSGKTRVALVASLLFGIHPMHVESVAWAAELKDLLYTFFFLLSYIFYLEYLKNPKTKFYVFALLLFLISLLSKAMAASLPVILMLTDYFKGRKLKTRAILGKVPFFLIAIALGIVAVLAQKSYGAISDVTNFAFPQRILFASYGFITYLLKLILPLNLSAFYPYPIMMGENVPALYYVYTLLFIGLVAYAVYSLRYSKKIIFGLGFFAVTIFLVLQLLPVGNVIMADRYSYIPSIGIFYLAAEGFVWLYAKKSKYAAIAVLSIFTVLFSVKTYARCGVWKNEMTLWDNVISQYQTVPIAYNNRGNFLKNENRNAEAVNDFKKAIELNPGFAEAYYNRGSVFKNENRNAEAINDFNKAIELNPGLAEAYNNRGIVLKNMMRNVEALNDYSSAIRLKPDFTLAYFNRGILLYNEKRYNEAISDYTKAIDLKTDLAAAYYMRGLAEFDLNNKDACCTDLQKAANLGYQMAAEALPQMCK